MGNLGQHQIPIRGGEASFNGYDHDRDHFYVHDCQHNYDQLHPCEHNHVCRLDNVSSFANRFSTDRVIGLVHRCASRHRSRRLGDCDSSRRHRVSALETISEEKWNQLGGDSTAKHKPAVSRAAISRGASAAAIAHFVRRRVTDGAGVPRAGRIRKIHARRVAGGSS